jgi:hypothetical protein
LILPLPECGGLLPTRVDVAGGDRGRQSEVDWFVLVSLLAGAFVVAFVNAIEPFGVEDVSTIANFVNASGHVFELHV